MDLITQEFIDEMFVNLVAHLTDLATLADKIVAVNDGWND